MPADLWDDLGLAAAAILTAIGGVIVAITGWIKSRRELGQVRAQLEPTPDQPGPSAPAPEPRPPATLYDVAAETRALVTTAIQMIGSLTQTDSRIEEWGRTEHTRLDVRIDDLGEELRFELGAHDVRIAALETGTQPIGGND